MDKILLLGQTLCIQDIRLQIYWVSNFIPAAEFQNFVDILETKVHMGKIFGTWTFFYLERQRYIDITRKKNTTCGHLVFIHKFYNEIFDKIIKQTKQQGKYETLHFLGSRISILLQIGSSFFQTY